MINIDLTNKTSLITGATGQLGRVMCKILAEAGSNIIAHYNTNSSKANELCDEINELNKGSAYPIQADITKKNSIESMKNQIMQDFQMPDIVVTNAVIQYKWTNILEQNEDDYESQFRSSVMQNVLIAKAFVPHLINKGWGRLIGINTECTMQCFENQSAYVSGKRGMDGIMRILAKEIGKHNITVNQIAPGWTLSENSTDPAVENSQKIPLKRRGTDLEVANVVAFLASDLASYISGAYVPVCGGNVMPTV
jgi:3-oxoacyl-[acyl-carrier protein] reductase